MAIQEPSTDQQAEQEERIRLDEEAFQLHVRRQTYRQIAQKMNISPGGAHKRVQRHLYRKRNVLAERPQDVRDFDIALIETCSRQIQKQARQGNLWAFALLMQSVGLCHRLRKDAPDEIRPYLPWNMTYPSDSPSQPIVMAPVDNQPVKLAPGECYGRTDPESVSEVAELRAREAEMKRRTQAETSREQTREQPCEQQSQTLADQDVHTKPPLPESAKQPPDERRFRPGSDLASFWMLLAFVAGTLLGTAIGPDVEVLQNGPLPGLRAAGGLAPLPAIPHANGDPCTWPMEKPHPMLPRINLTLCLASSCLDSGQFESYNSLAVCGQGTPGGPRRHGNVCRLEDGKDAGDDGKQKGLGVAAVARFAAAVAEPFLSVIGSSG